MAESKSEPHWSPNQYRAVQEYTYKFTANGELRIRMFFPFDWRPRDRRAGTVFFFGGGYTSGTPAQFFRHATYLAGRGRVSASADYRVKSRHATTPLAAVEDARSAMRWLRSRADGLGLDTGRIAAGGGSAGGHLAACTALSDGPDAPGEDVSVSPAADALVLFNPVLAFNPERAERFGLSEEAARGISPLDLLGAGAPPAILFYGTADKMFEEGRQYVAKAEQLGVTAELMTAEGAGHGFFNFSPWFERTLHRADRFLASLGYVAGAPTFAPPA